MIKIAVIGLGVMGKNHLRVLGNIPEVTVPCVCDPVAEGDFGVPLYKSVDEMLKNEKIDAAIIAVPTAFHKDVALRCIEKGVHLLIEKPVAPTAVEGAEIQRAASRANVKTAVGYIERFNPVVASLKSELSGKEIYSISITRVGPIPPRIADVGILTDLSVHDIDLIRFITGKEIIKSNIFKSQKIHNHYEDNAILSFELSGDITASITTNWLTPFKKRMAEIAAKEAYFEADLMNQRLCEYSHFEGTNKFNSYAISDVFVRKQEPLLNELEAFVNYIKTDDRGNLATIEDSIRTIDISQGK
ncbi:MAG: Gfo/Idh/MocA family oxidoreductase [Campylobacterales bacterium]|nr:Gfo/Idh/MocA family oxidoreductase [Campylobacterales bacterium]